MILKTEVRMPSRTTAATLPVPCQEDVAKPRDAITATSNDAKSQHPKEVIKGANDLSLRSSYRPSPFEMAIIGSRHFPVPEAHQEIRDS
jgi:hypothetical protein